MAMLQGFLQACRGEDGMALALAGIAQLGRGDPIEQLAASTFKHFAPLRTMSCYALNLITPLRVLVGADSRKGRSARH